MTSDQNKNPSKNTSKNAAVAPTLPGQMLNDVIAAAIAIAFTLIAFLVLAFIWLGGDMEQAAANTAVQIIKIVCLLTAGLLAARFNRVNGWINGIAAGLAYTVLAWVVLMLFTQWTTTGQRIWLDLLIAVGAGAGGGMLGMLFTR